MDKGMKILIAGVAAYFGYQAWKKYNATKTVQTTVDAIEAASGVDDYTLNETTMMAGMGNAQCQPPMN